MRLFALIILIFIATIAAETISEWRFDFWSYAIGGLLAVYISAQRRLAS